MRSFKLAVLCGVSAVYGAVSSFGAVTYSQLSGTGLTVSTATLPTELEDVTLAAATILPQQLTAMSFGYGVLAGAAAQTGAVFVEFYSMSNTASTGSVLGTDLGGFGGTISIAANTGTTTALKVSSFSNLNTLATPINFTSGSIGVTLTFTDSTGGFYSTVLTPLTSSPGTPTIGTSPAGVYRDTNSDGTFQATEFMPTLGNAYLSLTTVAVPEPSSVVLMSLAGVALLGGMHRLRRRQV